MNKIIFTGLGIILPMLAISLISYGQVTKTGLRLLNNIPPEKNSTSKTIVSTLHRGDVNSKAIRNFARFYKSISDEKWYEIPDALMATFTIKDIDYRDDYDKKGNWLHTMRTYDENKLPADIRHLVKSSYYDYNIMFVQEIENPGKPSLTLFTLKEKRN